MEVLREKYSEERSKGEIQWGPRERFSEESSTGKIQSEKVPWEKAAEVVNKTVLNGMCFELNEQRPLPAHLNPWYAKASQASSV